MKKRIISLLSALIMLVSTAVPVFAYTSVIYSDFKNAKHSELRSLFMSNFAEFDISKDGNTYDDATKSLIILEASQRDFKSFEELNRVITEVATEIAQKRANPPLLGLSGMSNVNLSFDSPKETDAADVFKIGGKEFIVLDKVTENGEDMFFVMAKDYYGAFAVDPENLGRWTDNNSKLLPYKLTNSMAFGNNSGENIPEEVLVHMDMLHQWNVEPGSGTDFQSETVLVAPISVISATEYQKYGEKIGLDRESGLYWTRTPVFGDSLCHFTVNTASPKTFGKNKGWGGNQLRPVFYLKSSFFKEEKMEKCGENITVYLEDILSQNDINKLYKASEIKKVFGSLSVTPDGVTGNAIVGETLSTDYTYSGSIDLLNVNITWEKSIDKISWSAIAGAAGKTYRITNEDAGYYIRAVFAPAFDSIIYATGDVAYAEKADAVFTDDGISEAVARIDAAGDVATLRSLLLEYYSLLHLDSSETAFSDNAAAIFLVDRVSTVSDVILLYNRAKALDAFAGAGNADAKEKAESQYLMGSVDEYKKLTEEQKGSVVYELYNLTAEKNKVSAFMEKAKEIIMLTRFNNVDRDKVSDLLVEYSSILGVDIGGLTNYQLEMVAPYVAGVDYGNDIAKLIAAVKEGVAKAKNISVPTSPVEGNPQDTSDNGFLLPSYDKPEPTEDAEYSIFTDLDSVPWGIAAINSLAKKGILSGSGNGTFSPMRPVTRNEFVKMIVSAFNVEAEGEDVSFEDIDDNSWSAKYIKAAVNAGIISGIDENYFGDGMNITRQDVAVISDRFMMYKGMELQSSSLKFADSGEISEYALMPVAKMCYSGIMNGVDETTFAPKGITTRAQAAVVVYNLMNCYNERQAAEEEAEGEVAMKSTGDKYDLVFTLGILKDGIANDHIMTRGELASALAVFAKYPCSETEGVFDDVKASHTYCKEIEEVYRNNLMAPETSNIFAPDEPATYGEAYDALIAASGYANLPGGTSEIESILRKEPVYAQKSDDLTVDMAKRMFFAALEIQVFTMGSTHSVEKSNKTVLNENFGVYKEKGIVNAVAGMSLGGREEMADDEIIITVDGKDYLYTGNDRDYSEYLGCRVVYYYAETDDEFKIIGMMITGSGSRPLTLSFEDIISAERDLSAITYDKGIRKKKAAISKNADFIYNGRKTYSITSSDLNPDNGYITLIDTNGDGSYDVVKIEKYEYIMVAQVDTQSKTVLDRFTWQTYSLNEDRDADKINITKNGRYIKMDYLAPGDIIAIAKSRDKTLINAYVSDKKVSGKVLQIMSDEYSVSLDGNILKCVKDFNFSGLTNSINITVGLDWNGYAVGYYTELAGMQSKIGYVYRIFSDDGETVGFNILTQDNEYVTVESAERLIANGRRAEKADIYSLLSYNEADKTIASQLIAYNLDQDGKMKSIYTSYTDNGIVTSQTTPLVLNKKYIGNAPAVIYNSFGMTLDFEYNFLKAAVMFDITMDNGKVDKESSYVTNIGAQVIGQSTSPERMYIYNADISKVSDLCVYEHSPKGGNEGYNEGFNTQAFLVRKVSTVYDEEESDVVTVFDGYHNGNSVSYTMSKKLMEEVDISKIKSGDVLLVWLSGSEINRFRRLFAFEETNAYSGEADLLCNYGDHNYDGSAIVRGGTNWDYAYDWAQHIIERAEGKSGSTTVAATRWASVYGKIELVFKSELYTYPVLKLKVAGKSETEAYTFDANTKVYLYDKSGKTVKVLDGNNINYSMKNAVVTLRYGNVRDVIIYEE